jgi:hypothetical protein
MESQWKKILDVLTCPSRPPSRKDESNDVSESDNNKQQYYYEPMMNNLSRSEENLKTELLRNYIDKVKIAIKISLSILLKIILF